MPSRRVVLASVAYGLSSPLVGCQRRSGTDSTPDNFPTTTTGVGPTETEYDGSPVSIALDEKSHWLRANLRGDLAEIRTRDAVALADLDSSTRDAVNAAIAEGSFTTSDPSTALLNGIDDVSIVEYQETYFHVEHTFPTYTLTVGREIDSEVVPDDRTATMEGEAIESNETVERILSHITPTGTNYAGRPYTTTRMPPALSEFLDQYDYVIHDWGTSELILTTTERSPPYAIIAEEATDQQLYGYEILEPNSFDSPGGMFVEQTLDRQIRLPLFPDERHPSLFPRDVPGRFEHRIEADRPLVLFEDSLYHFTVSHHHWEECPVEVSAKANVNTGDGGPLDLELAVENVRSHAVTLTMPGISPFGILHAYGPDGEQPLWTPVYESSTRVRQTGDAIVAESDATVQLASGERVAMTYTLGQEDRQLAPGEYDIPGFLRAKWQERIGEGSSERTEAYPFTVTVNIG